MDYNNSIFIHVLHVYIYYYIYLVQNPNRPKNTPTTVIEKFQYIFNLHCLLFQSQNAELRSAYCRLWPDIPTPSGSRRRRLASDKKIITGR